MFRVFNTRSATIVLALAAASLPLGMPSTQAQAGSRAKKAVTVVVSDPYRWRAVDASGWRRPYSGMTISANLSLGQWLNSH